MTGEITIGRFGAGTANLVYLDSGTIYLGGNLVAAGGADGGTTAVTFNGAGGQSYAGQVGTLPALYVNKSSGSVTVAAGLTAAKMRELHVISGQFTAPTGALTIFAPYGTGSSTVFEVQSGTSFDGNGGTVVLNHWDTGTGFETRYITIPGSFTLPNISFSGENVGSSAGSNYWAINGGQTLTVADDVQIGRTGSGTANIVGFTGGTVIVQGNVYANAGAAGGSGTFLFNTSGNQQYNSVGSRLPRVTVSKPSGSLVPAGGTTSLGIEYLILNSGGFQAPAGTLTIGRPSYNPNVTNLYAASAGLFDANGGTTEFYAYDFGGAAAIQYIDVPGGITFNHLRLVGENTGGGTGSINWTLNGAQSVTALGNFFLGRVGSGTANSVYMSSGTYNVGGSVTIAAGAGGGSSALNLNGPGTQSVTSASGVTVPGGVLTINKSSGQVTLLSNLTLGAAGQDLTIQNGYFDMAGYALTVSNGSGVDNVLTIGAGATLRTGCGALTYEALVNNGTLDEGLGVPNISITDSSVTEGGTLAFAVSLDTVRCSGNVTVDYQSYDGTATTANSDYTAKSGTATFTPGMLAVTIPLITTQDATIEGNETLTLSLSAATDGVIVDDIALGTIVNDDTDPYMWTGNAFPDTNWTTGGNWYNGVNPPNATQVAIFANLCTNCNATVDASIGVAGITMFAGYTGAITQAAGSLMTIGSSSWRMESGSFIGGSSDIDLTATTNDLDLVAGAFTSTSGQLLIRGPASASSTVMSIAATATFGHNTGTVTFLRGNGAGSLTHTISTAGAVTFNNLTLQNSEASNGDVVSYAFSGATPQVTGILKMERPSGSSGVYLSSNVDLLGSLEINAGSYGGLGEVRFISASDQIYQSTGGTAPILRINKTSGAVTAAAGTTSLGASGLLITSGSFVAPTGNLDLVGPDNNVTIFSQAAGTTFNANGGTLKIRKPNGGSASTYTMAVADVLDFNNLWLQTDEGTSGDTASVAISGPTPRVNGTFRMERTGGGSGAIYLNSNIDLLGNLEIYPGSAGSTAEVRFISASDQTYGSTGGIAPILRINKSSGAVTAAGGTTTLGTRALILTDGSFVAPAGDLVLMGPDANATVFNQAAGTTFDANGGTIKVQRPSGTNVVTYTMTMTDVLDFNNLWLQTYDITAGDTTSLALSGPTPRVNGTLRLERSIGSSAFVYLNSTVDLYGNLELMPGAAGGAGGINFRGTNQQTVDNQGGTAPGGTWLVNKTGGDVTQLANLSLATASQDLTIQAGTWDMAGYALTISNASGVDNVLTIDAGATLRTGCGALNYEAIVNNGTLENGVATPNMSIADASVSEGGTLAFIASLNDVRCAGDVTMNYQSYNGTATTANSDYTAKSGTATFTPGMLALTIPVITTQDATAEGNESLTMSLSGAANGTLIDNLGVGTIVNDDMPAFTWTGLGGNSNWTTAANWSTTVVPGASDTAIFNNLCTQCNATINSGINVTGLRLDNGYLGTITQSSGQAITIASGYVQQSGTFIGGNQPIYTNGLDISGGVFTSTSNLLRIGAYASGITPLKFTGGTFNHNSGTLAFIGEMSNWTPNVVNLNIPNGMTVWNLSYQGGKAGGFAPEFQWTLGSGQVFTVLNDFSMYRTAGTTGGGPNAINGYIDVAGNISSGAGSYGGNSTIRFTNGANQTYAFTGGRFPALSINKSGGSVTPAAGTSNLSLTRLALAAGDFTAPSGTFEIFSGTGATALSFTGGTYAHSSGTVEFTGTDSNWGANAVYINVPNGLTIANLRYTGGSASTYTPTMIWTLGAGQTLTVLNDFVLTRAPWASGGGGAGANLGYILVGGNVSLGAGNAGGSSLLTLNGTGAQSVSQSGSWPGSVLTINKPSGGATLASNLTLNTAGQDLTLQYGYLNMAGYALTVSNGSGVDNVLTLNSGTTLYTGCGSLNHETLVNNGTIVTGSNVLLSVGDASVSEGETATFTVTMTGASCSETVFNYATVNNTAVAGTNYTTKTGTVTIGIGQSGASISVVTLDDPAVTGDVNYLLSLSAVTGSGVLDPIGVGVVVDNDLAPEIFISDGFAVEGSPAVFTVSLTRLYSSNVTVNYTTVEDSALDDVGGVGTTYDFTSIASGVVTIPAGEWTGAISIATLVNTGGTEDPYEQFFVDLSGPSAGTLVDNRGVGLITESSPAPTPTLHVVDGAEAMEGGALNVTVSISGASASAVSFTWQTYSGTATSGVDFTGVGATVATITAGQVTVQLPIATTADTNYEGLENLVISLSSPSNATVGVATGLALIHNDDCPTTGWCQQAYLKAADTVADDRFGSSSSIRGDTIVIGAPQEDSSSTGVFNGTGGSNAGALASSGAAYVFRRTGATWVQQAYLKAADTLAGDQFGYSSSIDGDTVVVGAIGESSTTTGVINGTGGSNSGSAGSSGAAYVFRRTGATWVQEAYLKAADTLASDGFGTSNSVHGDTIVIGANGEDSSETGVLNGTGGSNTGSVADSGAVYVFRRTGTTWVQEAYLKAADTLASDGFGGSSSVHGDTLVIGASGEDSSVTGVLNGTGGSNAGSVAESGAAYVFRRTGATWVQEAYLKAADTLTGDAFGTSSSVHGDSLVIGASGEDSSVTGVANGTGGSNSGSFGNSGAAYVFRRTGVTWVQEAYLKAADTQANDLFGHSTAISGDGIIVGARDEQSTTSMVLSGTGGSNEGATSARGAAYVFRRTGATWVQEAYLKDSGAGSNFGSSIGMNGDTIVVGAPAEASPVTGVINGPWSSLGSDASWAGAAYVFYRKGPAAVIIQQSFSQADPTTAFPITFTVEFSKKIDPTTFNTADITQAGSATGVNWTITNTGDDRNFTLTATSSTTNGTIIPTIPASAVVDVDGNSNQTSSPNFDNSVTKNP